MARALSPFSGTPSPPAQICAAFARSSDSLSSPSSPSSPSPSFVVVVVLLVLLLSGRGVLREG